MKQRQQLTYVGARWRTRLLRWSRRFDEIMGRIRPERGRLQRLRHKFDKQRLD
jgi:hypothetical protein